jgi:hypothetical protein
LPGSTPKPSMLIERSGRAVGGLPTGARAHRAAGAAPRDDREHPARASLRRSLVRPAPNACGSRDDKRALPASKESLCALQARWAVGGQNVVPGCVPVGQYPQRLKSVPHPAHRTQGTNVGPPRLVPLLARAWLDPGKRSRGAPDPQVPDSPPNAPCEGWTGRGRPSRSFLGAGGLAVIMRLNFPMDGTFSADGEQRSFG